ncbi:MAG: hypothetical protein ACRCUP_01295 [Mycoplasmatales bacterium]
MNYDEARREKLVNSFLFPSTLLKQDLHYGFYKYEGAILIGSTLGISILSILMGFIYINLMFFVFCYAILVRKERNYTSIGKEILIRLNYFKSQKIIVNKENKSWWWKLMKM